MKMKTLHSPKVNAPAPRTWSNAKMVGNQFFVSGMTAHDGQGNVAGDNSMYGQAKTTFTKIQGMVEAAGGKMDDVVEMTIYVTDILQRKEVWRARDEFFSGDFPCSTLVEVKGLAIPGLLVEINCSGFVGAG
jgi:enamine deaminase RidA (YjgF/YER057c/UK114 family)